MAFRFPSRNWQEPSGFNASTPGEACAVCGSTYDIGFSQDTALQSVCEFHSHLNAELIQKIKECRKNKTYIASEWFNSHRYNSWEFEAVLPYLENSLLIERTLYCLGNCQTFSRPASTYDDAIKDYARELATRLKATLK